MSEKNSAMIENFFKKDAWCHFSRAHKKIVATNKIRMSVNARKTNTLFGYKMLSRALFSDSFASGFFLPAFEVKSYKTNVTYAKTLEH